MAQQVIIAGALFNDVPSISVPDSNSVYHPFVDPSVTTAAASDVAQGKQFIAADGTLTQGTASGGGSSNWTLLKTQSLGTVTATTTATDMSVSLEVTGVNDYDLLVFAATVDTIPTRARHMGTFAPIFLLGTNDISTKNNTMLSGTYLNVKRTSSAITSNASTTKYGIYPYNASVSDGTVTITLYKRSDSTLTGTINGSYTSRVYGVKLYNIIGS